MKFKKIVFAGLSLISLFTALGGDDFSKEIVKASHITGPIYLLEGAGGNMTASIGKDGSLLVDDDFAEMAEKLEAKLRELRGGTPRLIVNTHFHYDHTGGNRAFGSRAVIIAADEVRSRLMSEQTLWHKDHPAFPENGLPLLTYADRLNLYFNGEEVQLLHLPNGHTDGDSVVLFSKSRVASLGDLYFSGMYPIFHPEHRGSLKGLVKNLKVLLSRLPQDVKIVPGHGRLSTKAELKDYVAMIEDSVSEVTRGVKAGKSLQEIQKLGLSKKWEAFSHGYRTTDQWIASVYEEVTKGSQIVGCSPNAPARAGAKNSLERPGERSEHAN